MSYSLTFTETPQYLHVLYHGDFERGDGRAMWSEINDYLATNPQEQILVQEHPDVRDSLSTSELYAMGLMMANTPTRPKRIAHLSPSKISEWTLQNLRFVETVAFNRGMHLRLCFSRDEAEQWLRSPKMDNTRLSSVQAVIDTETVNLHSHRH